MLSTQMQGRIPIIFTALLAVCLLAACTALSRPTSLAQPNPTEPVASSVPTALNKPVFVEFYSTM